jgi:hypothetical protein
MSKRLTITPRRFVRDRDIHLAEPCMLSGRQLVLRRQQSYAALLAAAGSQEKLAAAIETLFHHADATHSK